MPKKPAISFQFENKRPSLQYLKTEAELQSSSVLWSDTVVTWSDAIALYGGSDRKQDVGPSAYIESLKPLLEYAKTRAEFKTTDTTWSDTAVTWSSVSAFYGGLDPKQSMGPSLSIDIRKPSLYEIGYTSSTPTASVTLYGGMPMGLLMAITYDQDYVI